MKKYYQIIILATASLILSACASNVGQKLEANDQVIVEQTSTMSKKQKKTFCKQIESTHTRLRKKIIPILWKNLKATKDNKITKKQLDKNWLTLVARHESNKLGKEFRFYKTHMLLNIRYGVAAKCPFTNQRAS